MRTLVRFEYDIENVKLFDIVDGGAVHGAFNGNLTIYFDMNPSRRSVWRRGASAVRSRAGG